MSRQKNTDNEKVFNIVLWTTIILVAVFSVIFLFLYFSQFHGKLGDGGTFAQFGDYLGGTVGTITAIAVFIATVMIIFLQKKELHATREELERSGNAQDLQAKLFQQQQFETTFFTLLDKMNGCQNDNDLTQFYLILRLIYQNIEKYSEEYTKNISEQLQNYKRKNIIDNMAENMRISFRDIFNYNKQDIITKYNNIVKSYLDNKILYKIFSDNRLSYLFNVKSQDIFNDIKHIVETYSLFEYLPNDFVHSVEKNILSYYKISSFTGNDSLIFLRIEVEKDKGEIEKYAQHNNIMYRLYTANNPNVPDDILMNILNSISFTDDDYKNQYIIFDKYKFILFNRNVYKLNKDTFYKSLYKIIEFCEFSYCNKITAPYCAITNDLIVMYEENNSIILDFIDFLLDLIFKKNIIVVPVKIVNYMVNCYAGLNDIIGLEYIKEIMQKMDKVIPKYDRVSSNEEDEEYRTYLQEQNKLHQEMKPKLLKMIDENKEKLNINHLKI